MQNGGWCRPVRHGHPDRRGSPLCAALHGPHWRPDAFNLIKEESDLVCIPLKSQVQNRRLELVDIEAKRTLSELFALKIVLYQFSLEETSLYQTQNQLRLNIGGVLGWYWLTHGLRDFGHIV